MRSLKNIGLIPILAVSFQMVPCAAPADMSWTEEVTSELSIEGGALQKEVMHSRIKLKQGGVKIENVEEGTVSYCNLSSDQCVVYETRTRTFEVMDLTNMKNNAVRDYHQREQLVKRNMDRASEAAGEAAADAESQLRAKAEMEVVEARRKLVFQSLRFFDSQDSGEIDGHPCKKFIGMAGFTNYIEAWVAQDITTELSFKDYSRFISISDPYSYNYFSRLPGFPIKTIITFGPLKITVDAKEFSGDHVPVSEFILDPDAREADTR